MRNDRGAGSDPRLDRRLGPEIGCAGREFQQFRTSGAPGEGGKIATERLLAGGQQERIAFADAQLQQTIVSAFGARGCQQRQRSFGRTPVGAVLPHLQDLGG